MAWENNDLTDYDSAFNCTLLFKDFCVQTLLSAGFYKTIAIQQIQLKNDTGYYDESI